MCKYKIEVLRCCCAVSTKQGSACEGEKSCAVPAAIREITAPTGRVSADPPAALPDQACA